MLRTASVLSLLLLVACVLSAPQRDASSPSHLEHSEEVDRLMEHESEQVQEDHNSLENSESIEPTDDNDGSLRRRRSATGDVSEEAEIKEAAESSLVEAPVPAAPELDDSSPEGIEDSAVETPVEDDPEQEQQDRHKSLERSESSEVTDDNHGWPRSRRSTSSSEESNAVSLASVSEHSEQDSSKSEETSESNSRELTDENLRSRRSTTGAVSEGSELMQAAESAVFMPSFAREKKKMALEECRRGTREYEALKKQRHHSHRVQYHCNDYCCYSYYSIAA